MSTTKRLRSQLLADWRSFVRRRTAVFFTFFFPVILIAIFGVLVRTDGGGTGLFTEAPAWYVPGYLAVVVLFTPLTRVSSEVARHRAGNRFEKLATTPLTTAEWLLSQILVNLAVIIVASALILGLVWLLTGARFVLSPLLIPFVVFGVALFCGVGALLGRIADSQDGAIAAANAVGLPLLFLSETFVPTDLLPPWFRPVMTLSPLTYFSRGVRSAMVESGSIGESITNQSALATLALLVILTVVAVGLGATAIPRTD